MIDKKLLINLLYIYFKNNIITSIVDTALCSQMESLIITRVDALHRLIALFNNLGNWGGEDESSVPIFVKNAMQRFSHIPFLLNDEIIEMGRLFSWCVGFYTRNPGLSEKIGTKCLVTHDEGYTLPTQHHYAENTAF